MPSYTLEAGINLVNEDHLEILSHGVKYWNKWRKENPNIIPDLSNASLFGITSKVHDRPLMKGYKTNLSGINLSEAILWRAFIESADLSKANLYKAELLRANLRYSNLSHADLREADLYEVDLYGSNLSWANLSYSRLTRARLVDTDFSNSNLENCNIYGISAWNIKINENTNQRNLIISDPSRTWEPSISVDDINFAQFLHLILDNQKISSGIDVIRSKVILILGRFKSERKIVLDAIKDELRNRNYIPVLFDFNKPSSLDLRETITLLARMARFIIADISDAKSIIAELESIVPNLPSVPVQPIILSSDYDYALFEGLKRYPWVLEEYKYISAEELLKVFKEKIIDPAEARAMT